MHRAFAGMPRKLRIAIMLAALAVLIIAIARLLQT
jgi:hypothetical protein